MCHPGFYSQTGLTPCMKCPKGSFSNSESSKICTDCNHQLFTSADGSSSNSDCKRKHIIILHYNITKKQKYFYGQSYHNLVMYIKTSSFAYTAPIRVFNLPKKVLFALRRLATLPEHSPLYHREQTSHIGLSFLFLSNFANRVTVLVHTHNQRV